MNHYGDADNLPELTDDAAIRILYSICTRATQSTERPFKAIFDARDAVSEEEEDLHEHDGTISRYLMHLADGARHASRNAANVDFVKRLKALLAPQGITLQDGAEDVTRSFENPPVRDSPARKTASARRMSFDDARVDERWLNDHSERLLSSPPPVRRSASPGQDRIRLPETERMLFDYATGIEDQQTAASSRHEQSQAPSEDESSVDGSLPSEHAGPSVTQLEQHAEAFAYTTEIRRTRGALNSLREQLRLRIRDQGIALKSDQFTLLKQAWNILWAKAEEHREERIRIQGLELKDQRVRQARDKMLLEKAFTNWVAEVRDERDKVRIARRLILQKIYFRRWKVIADEMKVKVQSILCRKFLNRWRDHHDKNDAMSQQAIGTYETSLLRRCRNVWHQSASERQAVAFRDSQLVTRSIHSFVEALRRRKNMEMQAMDTFHTRILSQASSILKTRLYSQQEDYNIACQHADKALVTKCFSSVRLKAKLAHHQRQRSKKQDLALRTDMLKNWQQHAALSRQACAANETRVMRMAFTTWNDTLRCKDITRMMDERIMVEKLFKLLLQGRARLFQQISSELLSARAFGHWRASLHQTVRQREDDEHAALEFRKRHQFKTVMKHWNNKISDLSGLTKSGADARAYFICCSTFNCWRRKVADNQETRKREAFTQLRLRSKVRLAKQCFARWREQAAHVRDLDDEAESCVQARLENTVFHTFNHWHDRTLNLREMDVTAAENDEYHLAFAALSAFSLKAQSLQAMDKRAEEVHNIKDLVLMTDVLKRMQWMHFTAIRQMESADALWTRNNEQHFRNLFRSWAGQASTRRLARQVQGQVSSNLNDDLTEMDSPSLRPASRLAARSVPSQSLQNTPSLALLPTPANFRTPLRSNFRTSRFRPLPTPARFTPIAIDSDFLAATAVGSPPPDDNAEALNVDETEPGQLRDSRVTPFARRLREIGISPAIGQTSVLRRSLFGRTDGGTNKSVRFQGEERFGRTSSS